MIPVSNKTRSITRVRYKHMNFSRQEKYYYNSCGSMLAALAACAALSMFVCRAFVPDADVKMRLNAESFRGETIQTKPAAILIHQSLRRHHRPDHPHRPYRYRPCYLRWIAAR